MPTISTFFGIIIRMFYNEHAPPHFHAEYQGQNAAFTFDGKLLAGNMESKVARRLIRTWARLHQPELTKNWDALRRQKAWETIAPLS